MERPPLPKARVLGVVERQRLEEKERARLKVLPEFRTVEIHVHVERMTDEKGEPRFRYQATSKRRSKDDAQGT